MSSRIAICLLLACTPLLGIEIHGHRGSRGTHPENTLPAFEEAVSAGAYSLELDLQLTGDGVPVLSHDPTVGPDRCLPKDGPPKFEAIPLLLLRAADLARFDCGVVRAAGFESQQLVPGASLLTLEAFLKWVRQNHVRQKLVVEIKTDSSPPPDVAAFVRTVFGLFSQFDLKGQLWLQSFSKPVLAAAKRTDSSVPRSLLTDGALDFCEQTLAGKFSMAFPDAQSVNEVTLRACEKAGLPVVPYTANEPLEWRRLIGMGVRGIITDYPRALRQFLSAMAR
ncbi:MAG: glycerophosphodiester phosphodiesterase family protein [Bdellovibrionota bacterium]